MAAENQMELDTYLFEITDASFRHITQSISGSGWDFNFSGDCLNDTPEELFLYGIQLFAEAAPLPLEQADDYTGKEIFVAESYDDDTGEPYFGLNVMEEHPVFHLRLKFLRRQENSYLIEITATVAKSVLGSENPLHLLAWAEEQPDHAYPA